MSLVKFLAGKSHRDMVQEWDAIAPYRDEQLATGKDVTFRDVLLPWVMSAVGSAQTILDVGCGTGRLADTLRAGRKRVVGIDPSGASIAIARSRAVDAEYDVASLEEWVATNPNERFQVAVANMVMMDVADLRTFCEALAGVVQGGRVVATITHPAFWPMYWRYADDPEFNYLRESAIEAPFKTTLKSYSVSTTHVHRPISMYVSEFERAGLIVRRLEELRGVENLASFPYPRFLAIEMDGPTAKA